jgi:DNA invertase Pin-like site-specific DNA recombinase
MTKAFAYLRVSGKGQVDGDGFPRQLAAIRAYTREHDIKIVRIFEERGVAGATELANRPAFVEMMTALHSNGTRLVLIDKLDRLARDLMIQETIIGDLRKNGFELISVAEPDLLQDDPSRKLMRQIFGAIAEYEKTMIVLKLRGDEYRAKQRAKQGRASMPISSSKSGWPPILDKTTGWPPVGHARQKEGEYSSLSSTTSTYFQRSTATFCYLPPFLSYSIPVSATKFS